MKQYKGYLIDLDGTMYRGKEKIEAAGDFVHALKNKGIPYLFVTNNSSRRPDQVADKLNQFDIPAEPNQVITSSVATASYIAERKSNSTAFYIGEEGLEYALQSQGIIIVEENPDYVVVGIDREISYDKLAKACLGVRGGATFISTNGDIAIPTERGLLPGNGSLTSVISVSTETKPTFIGKPEAIIMEQALKIIGLNKEDVIMVGDNYNTDILAGIKAGMDTLFVNTGVTRKEHLKGYDVQPTYAVDSLIEWIKNI